MDPIGSGETWGFEIEEVSVRANSLENQHRIAVAEEAVAFADGFGVGG
jgi:hypothetical protein